MTNIWRDYTIEVPGVPSGLQSRAIEDIGILIDAMESVAHAKGMEFLLNKICVTSCFEDDVNRLLSERSGLAGYVAARSNVRAIGKAIWIRSPQGRLSFAVIVDAKQMEAWELKNSRFLTIVLHELTHVLYEGLHIQRMGEEEYTSDADTSERWLDSWATMILDEFAVDRLVDVVVGRIAKKEDGQSWSLREYDEVQGIDWVQVLLDGLREIPRFTEEKVWQFRTGQIDVDDILETVVPEVRDVLRTLSHTASRYMGTEHWPNIVEQVKEMEASQRFFKEHLDTILAQLDDTQLPFEESLQIVALAVEGIFQNCGLSFNTVPEGVFISVDAPSR